MLLFATVCMSQTLLQRFEFENNLTNAASNYTMSNNAGMTPAYISGLGGSAGEALRFRSQNSFGQNITGNFRINSGGISNMPTNDQNRAFSFWLKVPTTSTFPSDILTFSDPSGGTASAPTGFVFTRTQAVQNPTGTHSRFAVTGGNGAVLAFSEVPNTVLNQWLWVSVSYERYALPSTQGTFRIFIGGVSASVSPAIGVTFNSGATNTFRLGKSIANSQQEGVNFDIDDVRIWNGMSSSQADIIYENIIKPDAATTQTVCSGSRIADLDATGFSGGTIQWFLTSGAGAPANTLLTDNTDYDVAQTYNGTLSAKVRVRVTVSAPVALPTLAPSYNLCNTAPFVGSDLANFGANYKFYSTATSTTTIAATASLSSSNNLFVSQVVNGCEGPRQAITVNFIDPATPTGNTTQTGPVGSNINLFVVSPSTNISWYSTAAGAANGTGVLNSNSLLINNNTYYAVQIISGCRSAAFAVLYNVGALSNQDFNNSLKFKMYPNPANSILNIDIDSEVKQVEIYSLQGQKVFSGKEKNIDISNLSSGMYMVRVQDIDGGTATQRLVKN